MNISSKNKFIETLKDRNGINLLKYQKPKPTQ